MCREGQEPNANLAPRDLRSGCFLCGLDPSLDTLRRLLRLEGENGGEEDVGQGQAAGGPSLPEAVRAFRAQGEAAVARTQGGVALVDAACQLVEAVLLGLHRHLPHVEARAELREGPSAGGDPDEVTSLHVHFDPAPLIGEIATRTRIAVSVYVAKDVCFSLQRAPRRNQDGPLVLRVSGLAMPRLPDVVRLRELLREELGQNATNQEACFAWWQQHKDRLFPLKTSKFHRLVESLTGMRSFQMLPAALHSDTFWGYMNTSDLDIEAFEFEGGGGAAVTVRARLRPPQNPEDEQARAQNASIARKMLIEKRSSGERIAPSAINVAAMIYGADVGQPGARLDPIVKLLSAAQWWGRGNDGWNQWDETWLCTDKKDSFGRIVEQQGRILWRVAGFKRAPEVQGPAIRRKSEPVLLGLSPLGLASFFLVIVVLCFLRDAFATAP